MPVEGLPSTLENMMNAALNEMSVSSFKIESRGPQAVVVIRLTPSSSIQPHATQNSSGVYRRKCPSQVNSDKRRAEEHRANRELKQVLWAEQQEVRPRVKRDTEADPSIIRNDLHFIDPKFPDQWYIVGDEQHNYMSNVQDVWEMGLTGKGVVVTIVDDGLDYTHPDLAPNYDSRASWDYNDDDPDPMPRYDSLNINQHGTRCGGEVAMAANNSVCGVGIAYSSQLGGIRMLDGRVTDRTEASALSHNYQNHVDIYSISWGPMDDGKTLDGPGRLTKQALEQGTKSGRNGKGVIYVLASGNGGPQGDSCNLDGYAGSIYTISVSSATQHYRHPGYGENCSSILTTTFSNDPRNDGAVTTTDLHHKCTSQHTGTSASAPMASGIMALVLEANSALTWRDMQHVIAVTSNPRPLMTRDRAGWYQNNASFWVSPSFGFGIMDPLAMVKRAKSWELVREQKKCVATAFSLPQQLTTGGRVEVSISTDGCQGSGYSPIHYLEHVLLVLTMDYSRRGAITAFLTSPSGTETKLLSARNLDTTSSNFVEWPLMSVHTWGENPAGDWIFRVQDEGQPGENRGVLKNVTLIMYGTTTQPGYRRDNSHLKEIP